MEDRSTVEDRRPGNSYHQVHYVFAARRTALGDDQRPTEGDSRQQGTRESLHQATDVRARDLEDDSPTDWQPVQLP